MTKTNPQHNPSKALDELLDHVLAGIDKTEDQDGWWPTSTGAEFGAAKKRELKSAILAAYLPKAEVEAAIPKPRPVPNNASTSAQDYSLGFNAAIRSVRQKFGLNPERIGDD